MTKQGHGHVHRGEVLAGKYRVDRVLGEGGMGVVVAAHHLQLDQKVALKFLLPDALENSDSVARFRREAQAAVKIKSEHVARVTDVGELENGAPYIVMEYLEGSDLADWLREHGPLPVEQAVDFVLQACEALAEAHVLGIVHRDLKPANLFCIEHPDGRPSIKILDFGISKITTEGVHDMTQTNSLFGSPQYMSPEQLRSSKGVDLRTDIWALGAILFELITGRPAFLAGSITELVLVIANDPPPSLGVIRPGLPPALEVVVNRCLEKDRTRRYPNVGELAVALEELAPKSARVSVERVLGTLRKAGFGDTAAPKSPGGPQSDDAFAPTLFEATPPGSWGHTAGRIGAGGRLVLAIGVALLLVGVVGIGLLLHGRQGTASILPSGSGSTNQPAGPLERPTRDLSAAREQAADSSNGQAVAAPLPAVPPQVSPSKPPSRQHTGRGDAGGTGPHPASSASSVSPSATPAPSASAPTKPNCNPPYVIDQAGDHQYKPECL